MPNLRYLRLLRHWAERDFRSRYATTTLRAIWAVLQPCFTMVIYVIIFGAILRQDGGDIPFLTYLLSGVVVYRIPAAALSSSGCLVDNVGVISHVSFPTSVIPVSQVVGIIPDVVATAIALVIVAAAQGISIRATLVLLPIVLMAAIVFAAAVCTAVSTVQVFVRDVQFVTPFVTMGLFFASPISYDVRQVPSWMDWLEWANPISVFVRALRAVTLLGNWPDRWFWLHLLGACAALVGTTKHLRSIEHRIVDLG